MKTCDYETTSEALFLWFTRKRGKSATITRNITQEKTQVFHEKHHGGQTEFTASTGWMDS
jgi:hypothetical protein